MRWLVFLICFNINFRVNAEEQTFFIQDPQGCLTDGIWCSVRNLSNKGEVLKLQWADVSLAPGSSVVILPNKKKVRVLADMIHVRAKDNVWVETYNTQSRLQKDGEVLIKMGEGQTLIRSQRGLTQVTPKGFPSPTSLPEGFQNWVGDMGEKGRALIGFPRSIDLKAHLRDWSRVYTEGRTEFKIAARDFARRLRPAIQSGSDLNRDVVVRSLASLKKRRRIERKEKAQRAELDARMRQLFRKRHGM